jgi:lysophospholipase L1-like esterase
MHLRREIAPAVKALPSQQDHSQWDSPLRWARCFVFTAALCIAVSLSAFAAEDSPNKAPQTAEIWVGSWATGPAGPAGAAKQYSDQTLRLIVHTSVGGSAVRVKISNTFGSNPLVIGAAHIALRAKASSIVPTTDHALTFGGKASFTIPAGGLIVSDPVSLQTPPLSDLAVSIYLPTTATASTTHLLALQTSYIASGSGDFTAAVNLPDATTTTSWDFLTGVDVAEQAPGGTIVALGDSITDGANSTIDTNQRWPNLLAARLQDDKSLRQLGVLDEGIIGNRILHPTETTFGNLFGPAALARFDRDVLSQAGVKYVIVLLGINDIGHPGGSAPDSEKVSADQIIAGHLQLIARAHEKGLKIYGCTLMPFENTTLKNFYSPEKEKLRQAVNEWMRRSGAYDAVIDFDKVVRDPDHPARFLPIYDGGDHLHPSDAGQKAMANAIDLDLFR